MIDLHCHILPGLDDGASDLTVALEMAEIASRDGIKVVACTPHVVPGVYNNDTVVIKTRLFELMLAIRQRGIELELTTGADVHIAPDVGKKLDSGVVPTLGGSRYFLLEATHSVVPPRLEAFARGIMERGYTPVFTHPERFGWIEDHYDLIRRLCDLGVLMQITAASLTGGFGRRARYWAERMLDEGRVDILATDAHNAGSRPPILSAARDEAAKRIGETEADSLVSGTPAAVLSGGPLPERRTAHCPKSAAGRGGTKRRGRRIVG